MPTQRGLVPPAIITSTVALIVCSVGWGALGMFSIDEPGALPNAMHRFLCLLLTTLTLSAIVVNLAARIVREIRRWHETTDDGYAAGYTDGLAARPAASPVSPAVRGLVRSPR